MKEKLNNIQAQLVKHENVLSVSVYGGDLEIEFIEGYQRTGQELLKVQKLLFDNKIFNFIKSEKVDFWTNELKQIKIYIHE